MSWISRSYATPVAILSAYGEWRTPVTWMGSSTIVFTQLGENLVAIETDKDTALRAGSQVHLTIDPERIHVFDAATGRSLAPPP